MYLNLHPNFLLLCGVWSKEEGGQPLSAVSMARLPAGALAGHSVAAVQAAAAQAAMAAQVAALEQLRDKLEAGEPPEKKMALPAEDHHRLLQRALQHNLLAMTSQIPMNIRINSQGTDRTVKSIMWSANGDRAKQPFLQAFEFRFRHSADKRQQLPLTVGKNKQLWLRSSIWFNG